MKFSEGINLILGLPKTIIANFKLLPVNQAIKLPILISKNTVIKNLKGTVEINGNIKTGMIKFGIGDFGIFDKRSRAIVDISGKMVFEGNAYFSYGSKINVAEGAEVIVGDNFIINPESSIICRKKITFGKNFLMSWDCLIMDTDFHRIFDENGKVLNDDKEIIIGSNVWVGCRNTILKGTVIGNDVVVAANTNVHGNIKGNNQIIGGNPIRIMKENITWG